MKPDKVVKAVETTIVRVTRDIKKKHGNTGSDKLNSLSKLVNAYNRLLERTIEEKDSDTESLDVGYYEKLEKECFGDGCEMI